MLLEEKLQTLKLVHNIKICGFINDCFFVVVFCISPFIYFSMIIFILYIFTLLEDKILFYLLYMENISGHADNIKCYPKSIIEEINSGM